MKSLDDISDLVPDSRPQYAIPGIEALGGDHSTGNIVHISARLGVRTAALSKKCCDMGPNPLSGSAPAVAVEIERQLDYIPGDDHDGGA
jgi:hypothetical protein